MKRVKKTVVRKPVIKPVVMKPVIIQPVIKVVVEPPVVTPTVTERTLPPHLQQNPPPEITLANGPVDEKSEYNLPMLLVVGVVIIVIAIAFWVANAHPHGF
jgi:hypothetical protein